MYKKQSDFDYSGNTLIILLIPILLKYHKQIFALIEVLTQILIEFKNELVLYRKRQQEIHQASLLKIELKRKSSCYEAANRESLRRIRVYIENRKKEMSEQKNEVVQETEEQKLGKKIFSKIKNHKKLSMGIAGILLVVVALIPELANYKITIFYCEDKNIEETCELVNEDLGEGISNLIAAFTSESDEK